MQRPPWLHSWSYQILSSSYYNIDVLSCLVSQIILLSYYWDETGSHFNNLTIYIQIIYSITKCYWCKTLSLIWFNPDYSCVNKISNINQKKYLSKDTALLWFHLKAFNKFTPLFSLPGNIIFILCSNNHILMLVLHSQTRNVYRNWMSNTGYWLALDWDQLCD